MKVVAAVLSWKVDILRRWLAQPGRPDAFIIANGQPIDFEPFTRRATDACFYTGWNRYFTGGWNCGIAEIQRLHPEGEYVWMCDDGTIGCTVSVMEKLTRCMDEHPDVAVASPGVFGTPHPHMAPRPTTSFRYVPFVDHPAAMLRLKTWNEVGAFDEAFASYGNTEDWTLRARKKGWKFGVDDSATVAHSAAGNHGRADWIDAFEKKWGTRDYRSVLYGEVTP